MKRYHFSSLMVAAFILNSSGMVFGQQQSQMEQHLEQERSKVYQGGETQEEKAYYEKVNPKNIKSGKDYYKTSHPLEEAPLPSNQIPESPLPDNRIPDNPLPENPI